MLLVNQHPYKIMLSQYLIL